MNLPSLTVLLPLLLVDDTKINKSLVVPVVARYPLTRNRNITPVLSSPVRITLRVFIIRIKPRIQILRAIDKEIIRKRLNGPLAHENGKLAITSQRLRIRTQQTRDIV